MKNIRKVMNQVYCIAQQEETTVTEIYIAYKLDAQDATYNMESEKFDKIVGIANDLYIRTDLATINDVIDFILEEVLKNNMDLDSDNMYENWDEWFTHH